MAAVPGLRSAYTKVGELVFFGRMLDKIRLSEQRQLPAGYNLGDETPQFFDGVCCRFLGVEYGQIVNQVRSGRPDNEILEWVYQTGKHPTNDQIKFWKSFMIKRGWRDDSTASLSRWKKQLGLEDRTDILTFFDLYEVDEGRGIPTDYLAD